jgi:hypothetical protein
MAPILVEARPNARWSLDFVHDQMANGRRFRILNITDDVTHECLGSIPTPRSRASGWRESCALSEEVKRRGIRREHPQNGRFLVNRDHGPRTSKLFSKAVNFDLSWSRIIWMCNSYPTRD